MKFMLMMGMKMDPGSQSKGIATWHQEEIQAHVRYMMGLNQKPWPQIAALYSVLKRITGNPLVNGSGNFAKSPPALRRGRGHLHELAGDMARAIQDYKAAALSTASLPESELSIRTSGAYRAAQQAQG